MQSQYGDVMTSDENKPKDSKLFTKYASFIIERWTFLVSASYLFLTYYGLSMSYQYYKQFNINIFTYADFRDIVFAGLRDPLAFLNTILITIVLILYMLVSQMVFLRRFNIQRNSRIRKIFRRK